MNFSSEKSTVVTSHKAGGRTRKLAQDGKTLGDFINAEEPTNIPPLTSSSISIPHNFEAAAESSAKSFYIETYGCQMNSADSEIVRAILLESSYEEASCPEEASVVLLNTCAIRDNAEKKIWARLHQFRSMKRKQQSTRDMSVALIGCMAERLKEKLLDPKAKLVDVVVGPDAYRDLPTLLSMKSAVNVQLSLEETYADITPVRSNPDSPSAFVSIMRGCNNMCSYCIVPFTRGRERSQELSAVVDQVSRLRDSGVKEVVLLGQNVNSYHDKKSANNNNITGAVQRGYVPTPGFTNMFRSRDKPGYRFADLLYSVAAVDPEVRVRFTSPHPKDFPDEVLDVIASEFNICNSVHMPAQSGSTSVLRRMRRGYSREAYLDLVSNIRRRIPDVSISSDFISGFCDENESEHSDTISLLKEVVFDQAFMFAYSLRDRTHASHRMEDNVPEDIKLRRLAEVIDTFGSLIQKKNEEVETDRYHVVLVEGTSRNSTEEAPELVGLSDTNKRCFFPETALLPSLEAYRNRSSLMLQQPKKGDYVVVKVREAGRQSLKVDPIAKTTLSEIKAIRQSDTPSIFYDMASLLNSEQPSFNNNNMVGIQ